MTSDQVKSCLAAGREALVLFAEMLADGTRTRAEIYRRARAEADAWCACSVRLKTCRSQEFTTCSTATKHSWQSW